LDAGGINQLDSSALDALHEIDRDYLERGVRLLFAQLKGPVRDVMCRAGFLQRLGQEQRVFLRTHDAVLAAIGDTPALLAEPGGEDCRAAADRIGCGPGPQA
jgi:SulP family sulfate permease